MFMYSEDNIINPQEVSLSENQVNKIFIDSPSPFSFLRESGVHIQDSYETIFIVDKEDVNIELMDKLAKPKKSFYFNLVIETTTGVLESRLLLTGVKPTIENEKVTKINFKLVATYENKPVLIDIKDFYNIKVRDFYYRTSNKKQINDDIIDVEIVEEDNKLLSYR